MRLCILIQKVTTGRTFVLFAMCSGLCLSLYAQYIVHFFVSLSWGGCEIVQKIIWRWVVNHWWWWWWWSCCRAPLVLLWRKTMTMVVMVMVMVMVMLQSSPRVAVEEEEEGNTLVVRGVTQLDEVFVIQTTSQDRYRAFTDLMIPGLLHLLCVCF